ncbi:hypothetical protein [Paenibacillus sp. FSL P4-0081]|uniref:beta-xylosidase family glycoside hydrolase n=1 Tax=Paenibacillus sp. FSL P4-0081 TaxID=1536769 RepID=UPI0022AE8D49|nr:hypothetical protein [Paenibacillus sp. FSL P4-0081]
MEGLPAEKKNLRKRREKNDLHHWTIQKPLLRFDPTREDEEAGLTVYMNEKFHYEIAITYDSSLGRKVILRRRIGSLWKIELESALEGSDVVLGLEADETMYSFYYVKSNGERVAFGSGECAFLSTEVAGGFTGVYFGLYATGNGKPCTEPAYFDWFKYIPQG